MERNNVELTVTEREQKTDRAPCGTGKTGLKGPPTTPTNGRQNGHQNGPDADEIKFIDDDDGNTRSSVVAPTTGDAAPTATICDAATLRPNPDLDLRMDADDSSELLCDAEVTQIPEKFPDRNVNHLTVDTQKARLRVPRRLAVGGIDSDWEETEAVRSPCEDIVIDVPTVTFDDKPSEFDEVRNPMFRSASLQRLWSVLSQTDDAMTHKRERELQLKIFVVFLFLVIVGGVITTWVIYKEQLQQSEMSRLIHFEEDTGVLTVKGSGGQLTGHLGVTLPRGVTPQDCTKGMSSHVKVCARWPDLARLTIEERPIGQSAVKCYDVTWTSLRPTIELQADCFSLKGAHWYGGPILNARQDWPIEANEFNSTEYLSGYKPFSSIVERYWLTTHGISISIDSDVPLHVSMERGSKLCFQSRLHRLDPHRKEGQPLTHDLIYTLCTGDDVLAVHQFIQRLRPQSVQDSNSSLMQELIISLDLNATNQMQATAFANEVSNLSRAIIELKNWREMDGDFTPRRQPCNASGLIRDLRVKGHDLVLEIDTLADIASKAFEEGARNEFWVRDWSGKVTGLVQWHGRIFSMLDITNPAATSWYLQRLNTLMVEFDVTSFSFTGGDVRRLPVYSRFYAEMTNLNNYTAQYVAMVEKLGPKTQLNTAHLTQHIPLFLTLTRPWSWGRDGLPAIIPSVLTCCIHGYHFVAAELANPGYGRTSLTQRRPERALYVRWIQLAAFLPVMKVSVPPWVYDSQVVDIARRMIEIRRNFTLPLIERVIRSSKVTHDSSIVRPMWWLAPSDAVLQTTDDQFLIGRDVFVAPVITADDHRRVYVPPGSWRQLDIGIEPNGGGTGVFRGPAWINLTVPLWSVPHFERV